MSDWLRRSTAAQLEVYFVCSKCSGSKARGEHRFALDLKMGQARWT
jgi:hypothetical protein